MNAHVEAVVAVDVPLASPRYEALDAERCEFRPDRPLGERLTRELFVWHPGTVDRYSVAATTHSGLFDALRSAL